MNHLSIEINLVTYILCHCKYMQFQYSVLSYYTFYSFVILKSATQICFSIHSINFTFCFVFLFLFLFKLVEFSSGDRKANGGENPPHAAAKIGSVCRDRKSDPF